MITKAIITGFANDEQTKFLVRIPLFENAGSSDKYIETATLCYEPGNLYAYGVNDIVFVDFEDSNLSKPVIIGKLYLGDKETHINSKSCHANLNITDSAILPKDTQIGEMDALKLSEFYNEKEYLEKKANSVDSVALTLQSLINELAEKNIIDPSDYEVATNSDIDNMFNN